MEGYVSDAGLSKCGRRRTYKVWRLIPFRVAPQVAPVEIITGATDANIFGTQFFTEIFYLFLLTSYKSGAATP